jgi:predicted nucleic acid-binding protein
VLEHAASINAHHSLSLADAWIAAAAQQVGANLLYQEPKLAIANLPQEWLG